MEDFKFTEAKKIINNQDLLNKFLQGKTYSKLMDFICALQQSVQGKNKNETPQPQSESLINLIDVLTYLEELIKEVPPLVEAQRFGNKAYKTWYAKFEEKYNELISKIINKDKHKDLDLELKNYFLDCFGSSKRLDFGTGHELNFICILLILFETGYYKIEEFASVVHHIFFKYLLLVRNLQVTYRLEPAGAHGVWGLDEYHFLPFVFGASELIHHPEIKPSSIHDEKLMQEYSETYMYLSCIKYIKQTKKGGSFGEFAPVLESITSVPNWEKVSKGLVKMFVDEVMKKIVIMQHFYFGSILKFE